MTSRPAPSARFLAIVALALASASIGAFLVLTIRGLAYFQDEWAFIVTRRDWNVDVFLRPHNEHWQLFPILAYKISFAVRGLYGYGVLGLASTAVHLIVVWCLFAVLRRSVHPMLALLGSLAMLAFAWADEVLLWPVNLSFTLPVGFGLLAYLAWSRLHRTWITDALGTLALLGGLASGLVAVAFVPLAASGLWNAGPPGRRLIYPAASLLVFGAWYLAYSVPSGEIAPLTFDPLALGTFVASGLSALSAAALALDYRHQMLAAIVLAATLGAAAGLARQAGARTWLPLACIVLLYAVVGVSRYGAFGPEGALAPRYLYPAFALLMLTVLPLVERARRRFQGRALFWVAVGVVTLMVGIGDLGKLGRSVAAWGARSDQIRAELAVVNALRPAVAGTAAAETPIDSQLFFGMTGRAFFAAVDALGSGPFGGAVDALHRLPREERTAADQLIERLLGSGLRPLAGALPPTTYLLPLETRDLHDLEVLGEGEGCTRYAVTGDDPFLSLPLGSGARLWVRTDGDRVLQIFARVLADQPGPPRSANLERGTWYQVTPTVLPSGLRWWLRIDPPVGSRVFEACLQPGTGGS